MHICPGIRRMCHNKSYWTSFSPFSGLFWFELLHLAVMWLESSSCRHCDLKVKSKKLNRQQYFGETCRQFFYQYLDNHRTTEGICDIKGLWIFLIEYRWQSIRLFVYCWKSEKRRLKDNSNRWPLSTPSQGTASRKDAWWVLQTFGATIGKEKVSRL